MGKTLAELNVKPGDVVRYCNGDLLYTVEENQSFLISGRLEKYPHWDDVPYFTIVSRAEEQPTLWRDMTDAEKGALLLAKHEGKVIEYYSHGIGWEADRPNWMKSCAYRIKPEPKVQTVVMEGADFYKGPSVAWRFSQTGFYGKTTHRITFNLIDGEPDPASIKMEEL